MYEDTKNPENSYLENNLMEAEKFTLRDDQIMDTFVIIWGKDDRIHYMSKVGEKHFGLQTTNYEKEGVKWSMLFDNEIIERIRQHFITSTEPLHLKNVTYSSYIEEPHAYAAQIRLMILDNKTYYIGEFKNMIEMSDVYDYLEEKNRLITSSWLAAGLVHEIRNPLTSLRGFLQLVKAGITQKEEYYQVMINEVDKLEDITNELLSIAKPNKKERQKESVKQLIDDVIFLMSTQTNLRNIDFNLQLDEGLYTFCKASQIKQVLINLIKNSAEAMDYEGIIQISTYEQNGDIYISIKDDGQGIESNQIKETKQPFYTTKSEGTGLGLVMSNHILQSHNGGFSLKKNAEKGITVTVNLPVME